MTRKESIVLGFVFTFLVVGLFITMILTVKGPKTTDIETQLPEREGIVIDGHNIEVVYDDYGAAYLKYVIGPMKIIYIPVPPEAELPDNTDSLKFYYTKTENNGKENKRTDNKRNAR